MSARLQYIVQSMRRHRLRSVLTAAFVAIGFATLLMTMALANALSPTIDASADRRLLVLNGVSTQMPLPTYYAAKIAGVEGVAQVSHAAWVGAFFRQPGWGVPAFAVDAPTFFAANPSLQVGAAELDAWRQARDGVLIDRRFAQRYGLARGDRLPLQSSIWQLAQGGVLDLRVSGFVDEREESAPPALYVHYDYFEDNRQNGKGLTSYFVVQPAPGASLAAVAQRIDALFARQAYQGITQTAPVHVHMQQLLQRMFDFGKAITFIDGTICLLLAVLLVTNIVVLAQRSLDDYALFGRIGFPAAWIRLTAFLQHQPLVACGALAGATLGWLGLIALRSWGPPQLSGLHLGLNDAASIAGVVVLLALATGLPALFSAITANRTSS
ncbi:ABC transporter permease [Burkholderia sp. 22PA0106]|uniref:ABC transporter permease n=1 Tax=Burkholderia sp. 22PA0106 TaxID=3237371 RepID=UPI0039C2D5D9